MSGNYQKKKIINATVFHINFNNIEIHAKYISCIISFNHHATYQVCSSVPTLQIIKLRV